MFRVTSALVTLAGIFAWSINVRAGVVIETVTVGSPGNAGEGSGWSYGGYGPDRICGAVDYAYNIGKFEVAAAQYTEFLNAVADEDTYGLYYTSMADPFGLFGCNIQRTGTSPNFSYSVAPDWADRPVNYVSWGDAARFCNWLHNGQPTGAQNLTTTEDGSYYLNGATSNPELMAVVREEDATWVIPSEDEWYKAAYHYNDGVTGNYYDYPTSSDSVPGYVNDSGNLSGTGTAFTEGGTDPGNYATYDGDGGIDGIGSPYYRTEVGEWENSDSPYGTADQGGNVWEWNEAVPYVSVRGARGGSFYHDVGGDLHAAGRDNYGPMSQAGWIGFRVAEVPERGDFDADGDLDLADYAQLDDCLSGPGVGRLPACGAFDQDRDDEIDLSDFASFQIQFTGPQ
ncbi:MAG: SUMF1/EgtB/PvdO family nonheme iron enzyme [Phycisphaerales bacterium]|nr:MAG: SUMF1/EgtB/PvdO family nonheme iron enzyme [Phycisphaerales bacterium]